MKHLAALGLAASVLAPSPAFAADARGGVYVQHADSTEGHFCVEFAEDTITGYELLFRTGIELGVAAYGSGTAICRIDGRGCNTPMQDCFCAYPAFWRYFTREPGTTEWTFSEVGPSDRRVSDGAMDAWIFTGDEQARPPDLTLEGVCAAAARDQTSAGTTESAPVAVGVLAAAVLLLMGTGLVVRRRRSSEVDA